MFGWGRGQFRLPYLILRSHKCYMYIEKGFMNKSLFFFYCTIDNGVHRERPLPNPIVATFKFDMSDIFLSFKFHF